MLKKSILTLAALSVAGFAGAQAWISELFINPPGTDNGLEAIELAGPANFSFSGNGGWFFLVIEGEGGGIGTIDQRLSLSGRTTGSNGLFLWRDASTTLLPAPEPQTNIFVTDFNPDIENGGNTYLLGFGTPPAVGTDLDVNNDGTLDFGALGSFTVVDAVSYREAAADQEYADEFGASGTALGDFPFTPDTLYRFRTNNGAGPSFWMGGDTAGSGLGPYTYLATATFGVPSGIDAGTFQLQLGTRNFRANSAPVAVNDGYSVQNDQVLNISTPGVVANDTDADGNTLTAQLVSGPSNVDSFTFNPDGSFLLDPVNTYTGPITFTYRVLDGGDYNGVSNTATVTVTVTGPANQTPEITLPSIPTPSEDSLFTFQATATDPDNGQTLTFSLTGGVPAGMTIDPNTGIVTWTPSEQQGGQSFTFGVRVTDNGNPPAFDEESVTVTVTEVNVAPELGTISDQTADELSLVTFTATATDIDEPAQTLTFSLVGAPSGASIDPNSGVFTWTPAEDQGPGTFTFDVVVSDGVESDSQSVTITVNEVNVAPELGAIADQTADELTLITFTATATDSDLPAQTLTFSLAGAPSGATIDPNTGVFTWTPAEDQGPSSYTFDVIVSDDFETDSQSVTINVNEANAAPELGAIADQSGDELSLITFTATATDSDLPAQNLSFSLVDAPSGASIDSNTGVFTWTPAEDQGPGTFTFDVVVSDGSANDSQSVTITVNEVNVAPELGAIADQSGDELSLITFTATATDSDLPAQNLSFSLVGAPSGATIDSNTGVFTWTPAENQGPGTFTFDVVVSDGSANDSQSVTITVNEVNVAPELGAIADQSGDELSLITFTATATDSDLPAQNLSFSLVGAPSGATIDSNTGVFTWTPAENQGPGSFSFDVVVSDGTTTDSQSVMITVNEVNVAPELGAIADQSGNELSLITFTATATDSDLPAQTLSFSLVGAPTGASIDSNTGVFTWTPDEEQGGPGTFTFNVVVSDGTATDSQSVTITVSEVNVAPELDAISNQSVDVLQTLTIDANANDSDLPANTLTFELIGAPAGMTIDANSGVISWTPGLGTEGVYTFTVKVADNGSPALSDEQQVQVTVSTLTGTDVEASNFSIWRGVLQSGGLSELLQSDDQYLVVRRVVAPSAAQPDAGIFLDAAAPQDTASGLRFRAEVNSNATPVTNGFLVVDLFNQQTQQWERLYSAPHSRTDQVIDLLVTEDATRFVATGTNAVRARIGLFDRGFTSANFVLRVDRAFWTIRP